jgi:hypothetical protein
MSHKQPSQPDIPSSPLAYLWFLAKEQRLLVLLSLLVATTAEFIAASIPYILRSIIDAAEAVGNGAAERSDVIFWAALFPIAVFVMDMLWRSSGFMGMRWMTRANAYPVV